MIELPKQMQMNLGPTAGATVEEERQVGILGSKMGDYREQPPEQRQGKAIEGITHLEWSVPPPPRGRNLGCCGSTWVY